MVLDWYWVLNIFHFKHTIVTSFTYCHVTDYLEYFSVELEILVSANCLDRCNHRNKHIKHVSVMINVKCLVTVVQILRHTAKYTQP